MVLVLVIVVVMLIVVLVFCEGGGDVDCGVGFGDSGKRCGDFSNSAAGADNSCEVWLQQRRGKE